MAKSTRACGFVIFQYFLNRKVKYLLLQATYGNHHWSPPKGYVDPGESDIETAKRETEEETGFNQNHLKYFENVKRELRYEVDGKPKTVVYWLAEVRPNSRDVELSSEHQEFKWVDFEEACSLIKHADFQNMLKDFDNYIRENII